jgi:glyoxylase-like metal-dependent hydrolase (beta-lactamase superfamily II)
MKLTCINTGYIDTWLNLHSRPLAAEKIRIEVPVPCYLIEHAGKKVLFDAGQKPLNKVQDPMAKYYVRVTEKETAVQRLAAINIAAEDIDIIVISHAHSDHYAGLIDFPRAQVIVQHPAEQTLQKFGNQITVLNGEYDLFGDGKAICLPTPGHSADHHSLLLTMDDNSRKLLLGDVVYLPQALDYEPTAEEYNQNPDYYDSIRKVRAMRDGGVEIIFGHDPYRVLQ